MTFLTGRTEQSPTILHSMIHSEEKISSILPLMQEALAEEDFEAVIQEADEESPLERLVLPVAENEKGEQYIMQVFVLDNSVPEDIQSEFSSPLKLLQIVVALPIEVNPNHEVDFMRLMFNINSYNPMGAFLIKYPTQEVYFSKAIVFNAENPDLDLLMESFFMIINGLLMFGPMLTNAAKGILTADNFEEEFNAMTEEASPKA